MHEKSTDRVTGPAPCLARRLPIALLQFLTIVGLGRWIGYTALLIGHIVICLPFSIRTVAISLHTIPTNVEAAAGSLGAPPWAVWRYVTLPLLMPGIYAGMAFAFIHVADLDYTHPC